jgi:hypothetical protein
LPVERVTGAVYRLAIARVVDHGVLSGCAGRRPPASRSDERGELLRGCCAHARQEVLVGVHGEGRMLVTEPLADDLDRHASGDEQRGVGAAGVVEADAR